MRLLENILVAGAVALLTVAAKDALQMIQATPPVRIAVCQTFCIDGDPQGSLCRIEHALIQAARERAVLACFPW